MTQLPALRARTPPPLVTGGRWLSDLWRDWRLRSVGQFLGSGYEAVLDWWREFRETSPNDWSPDLELYVLVRARKPEHVVETGVRRGWSSASILRALDRNGRGHLTSVDLPTQTQPGEKHWWAEIGPGMTGCDVPGYLRDRWTLIIGDARTELPKLEGYDFFFHDSDHSYEHQQFEFATALRHLPAGGVLAADDIDWSVAWDEFARTHPRRFTWPPIRRQRGAVLLP